MHPRMIFAQMEVQNVLETRNDLRGKLKEVSLAIPKISEAILYLRNEVSEGARSFESERLFTLSILKTAASEFEYFSLPSRGKVP